MNSEANKRAAMAAWQAFRTRDPGQIAAVFTEDAEWLAPANKRNGGRPERARDLLDFGKNSKLLILTCPVSVPFRQSQPRPLRKTHPRPRLPRRAAF